MVGAETSVVVPGAVLVVDVVLVAVETGRSVTVTISAVDVGRAGSLDDEGDAASSPTPPHAVRRDSTAAPTTRARRPRWDRAPRLIDVAPQSPRRIVQRRT